MKSSTERRGGFISSKDLFLRSAEKKVIVNKGRRSTRWNFLLLLLALFVVYHLMFWLSWDYLRVGFEEGEFQSGFQSGLGKEIQRRFLARRAPPPFSSRMLLVVHACHGMSNRLRALASAMAIANATGRALHLVWLHDEHVDASFHDLFDNREFVVWDSIQHLNDHPEWPASFDKYNYMENEAGAEKYKYIDDRSPNHIYVKSAYVLKNDHSTPNLLPFEGGGGRG